LKVSENMNNDEQFRDAFQEYINLKYGLESPKDRPRAKRLQRDEILSRYTERDFSAVGATEIKKSLTEMAGIRAERGELRSVDEVMVFLKQQIGIEGVRYVEGKNGGYVALTVLGHEKELRLKGSLFDKATFKPEMIPVEPEKKSATYHELLAEHREKRTAEVDRREGRERRDRQRFVYTRIAQEIHRSNASFTVTPQAVSRLAVLDTLYSFDVTALPANSVFLSNDIYCTETDTGFMLYNRLYRYRLIDTGGAITIRFDKNPGEAVRALLEMAEAKGWDMHQLTITGSSEFIREVKRQIKERDARIGASTAAISGTDLERFSRETKDGFMREYTLYQGVLNGLRTNAQTLRSREYSQQEYTRINTEIDPARILPLLSGSYGDVKRIFFSAEHERFVIQTRSDHYSTLCDYVSRKLSIPVSEAMQRITAVHNGGERVPVIRDCKADVKKMREEKRSIADGGYDLGAMKTFVDTHYASERFSFLKDQADAPVFLVMPSTSGMNRIPELIAHKLQSEYGGTVLKDYAIPLHTKERKTMGVITKIKNPAQYSLVYDLSALRGKKVFVVDDVFNTGEGYYNLNKLLRSNGIDTDMLCLGSTSRQMTSERSIERFSEKIAQYCAMSLESVRERLSFLKQTSATFEYQLERQWHGSSTDKEAINEYVEREAGAVRVSQETHGRGTEFNTGTVSGIRDDGASLVGIQSGDKASTTVGRRDLSEIPVMAALREKKEHGVVTMKDLDVLKQLDLISFMQKDGYRVDRHKSTRSTVILKKDSDAIGVSIQEGKYVYYNFNDPSDKGTIIDYVKRRYGCATMNDIIEHIGRVDSLTVPEIDPVSVRERSDRSEQKSLGRYIWERSKETGGTTEYLKKERGISVTGQGIRLDTYGQTVFKLELVNPDTNKLELCGVSVYASTSKRIHGAKGLHIDRPAGIIHTVVITESPVDSLSFKELYPDTGTAYISTMGRMGKEEADSLRSFVQASGCTAVIMAVDADTGGDTIGLDIRSALTGTGVAICEQRPESGKDWNDVLKAAVKAKSIER